MKRSLRYLATTLAALSLIGQISGQNPKYKQEDFKNVTYYVIPHSHTDAGWWLTYNAYYHGRTRNILTTTYQYLNQKYQDLSPAQSIDYSKYEKFIWADYAFFMKWWNEDAITNTQENMKKLINRGVFSLENGGSVQQDEALSDYKSIMFMFDSSLQFIKDNFGTLPKVALAIDAFGHSSLTPYLYHYMGYEGIVLHRMPYELYGGFRNNRTFFFSWEGDNEKRLKVYRLRVYSLDEKFNLDKSRYSGDSCFKDTDACAEQFMDLHLANQTYEDSTHPGRKIAFQTFGTDFAFQQAPTNFGNAHQILNNLQRYLNNSLDIKFSTFTDLHNEFGGKNGKIAHKDFNQVYRGDMFVYDEENGDNWSGYFGSKPELKHDIKKVFNHYKALESLFFACQAELARLKSIKFVEGEVDRASQDDFKGRLNYYDSYLKTKLQELQKVRNEISILLHHDAISGTCSNTPQQDYQNIASAQNRQMDQIAYDLIEKLGRVQIYDRVIDMTRTTQVKLKGDGTRGEFQVLIFNPLHRIKTDKVSIEVKTVNVKIVDIATGKEIKFDLVNYNKGRKYAEFALQMKPLSMVTLLVTENSSDSSLRNNEITPQGLGLLPRYTMRSNTQELAIEFDIEQKLITKFSIKSLKSQNEEGYFNEEIFEENVVFYPAANTHSCIYLFNPKQPKEIEKSYAFEDVQQLETNLFMQLRFKYSKNGQRGQRAILEKVFTLNKDKRIGEYFNISYSIQNFDNKELFASLKRVSKISSNDKYRVFTDNSAFSIEREYNKKYDYKQKQGDIGKVTYPYLNGLIWDSPVSAQNTGNTINLLSNRPGGVIVLGENHQELNFFLTRNVNNVNWDKGLPDRLDDTALTRLDLVFSFNKDRQRVLEDKIKVIEAINDQFLVIQGDTSRPISPFDLPSAEILTNTQLEGLDLIDFITLKNNDTFVRVRNYQNRQYTIPQQITTLDQTNVKVTLRDENLAIHCLEKNTNKINDINKKTNQDQYIYDHRQAKRFETIFAQKVIEASHVSGQTISFEPFEIKCLRLTMQ